jgi:hypothetical protein
MRVDRPPRLDRAALGAYLRVVRDASRVGREAAPDGPCLEVDARRAGWYRAAVTHLDVRLPAGSYGTAAHGGLQDSVPRSGLLGLHARLAGVGPVSWEDPALAQIWLRGADYLVPRADVGVFTRGAMPRDPAQAAALDALAEATVRACGGGPRPTREVARAIGDLARPEWLRLAGPTGRILLRWDASRIDAIPVEPPEVDPEGARQELARRFLRWHGPASDRQFAKWAGVPQVDAARTWQAIRTELVPVSVAGRARWLLAAQEPALREASAPRGARLLPMGDPYLQLDVPMLTAAAPSGAAAPSLAGRTDDRRLLNSLGGRILADGDLAGAWGRRGADVTLALWDTAGPTDRIEAEAAMLAGPLGATPRVRWLGAH